MQNHLLGVAFEERQHAKFAAKQWLGGVPRTYACLMIIDVKQFWLYTNRSSGNAFTAKVANKIADDQQKRVCN